MKRMNSTDFNNPAKKFKGEPNNSEFLLPGDFIKLPSDTVTSEVIPFVDNKGLLNLSSTCKYFLRKNQDEFKQRFQKLLGCDYGHKFIEYNITNYRWEYFNQVQNSKIHADKLISLITLEKEDISSDVNEEEDNKIENCLNYFEEILNEFTLNNEMKRPATYCFPVIRCVHDTLVASYGISNSIEGYNLLSLCILMMDVPCTKFLIEQGYETCPNDECGFTPLMELLHNPENISIDTLDFVFCLIDSYNKFNLKVIHKEEETGEGVTLLCLLIQQNTVSDKLETDYQPSLKRLIAKIIDKLEANYLEEIEIPKITAIPIKNKELCEFAIIQINNKCNLNIDVKTIIDADVAIAADQVVYLHPQ